MIELTDDNLVFSFPEVHPQAKLTISLQRTLRIPDDGNAYPLPPGLGNFPIRHIDDYANRLPDTWLRRGGVIVPMYQAKALWINFSSATVPGRKDKMDDWDDGWGVGVRYPFAVKIAAGKINAVTGGSWRSELSKRPQDYVVAPKQPWLDGYCVERGLIRQFVAMPLGSGYSAEEQLTGKAEFGGLQLLVCPMKRKAFDRRFPEWRSKDFPITAMPELPPFPIEHPVQCECSMGLAPGGRMRQQLYDDPYALADWDTEHSSRCFAHLANSMLWRSITGENPPGVPLTAAEYARYNLPWFDYYDENASTLSGGEPLKGLKSVADMGKEKGVVALPENESVEADVVINLRRNRVREEEF